MTYYEYQNQINNSKIRNNQSQNLSLLFFGRTTLPYHIIIENNVHFNSYSSYFEKQKVITFQKISTYSKLIFNYFKSLKMNTHVEFFKPDLSMDKTFLFWDFEVVYTSQKYKWLHFEIKGKNLLNTSFFVQNRISDFQEIVYQSALLPMRILFTTQLTL